MNVGPTITRELRAQARQPVTYALRLLGAMALLVESAVFAFQDGFANHKGDRIFCVLNGTLFLFIWLIVPISAADSISRERREGTIGLLFLTPLKAREIVTAKGIVHALRALTLWLAVLPVLTIPFLVGGVGWREVVLSVLVNSSSICCALAAGILASCLCKRWTRALVLSIIAAATIGAVFMYATGFAWLTMIVAIGRPPMRSSADEILSAGVAFTTGFYLLSMHDFTWGTMFAEFKRIGVGESWLFIAGGMALCSLLLLRLVIRFASHRLERTWREEPPSVRQQQFMKALATPLLGRAFLRQWLRRKLERNPVGWLETRTWSGRTVTWGWLAAMTTFYCYWLAGQYPLGIFYRMQNLMELVLLAGLAATAAGSFQRERETGVMELLLVSPMTEWQIINGRVRGLWGQFLPAVGLLIVVWVYMSGLLKMARNPWIQSFEMDLMPLLCTAYGALPVIGLYSSLHSRTFVSAFLMTVLWGLLVPYILTEMIGQLFSPDFRRDTLVRAFVQWFVLGFIQFVMANIFASRLQRDLRRRNFAFSRARA